MAYAYTTEVNEKRARAVGLNLPISTKQSIEICSFLRGKPVEKAKTVLKRVGEKQQAIPFTRFNWNVGHRRGMASGRYPLRASAAILTIIESAEANAQFKGLTTKKLVLKQLCAQKAGQQYRFGRFRGRKAKRTHIEVIVEETP